MTLLEDFPVVLCEMILLLEILFLLVFTEKMFENRRELQEILYKQEKARAIKEKEREK
jgi:hypothetical protein